MDVQEYTCFMCSENLENLDLAVKHLRTCEYVKEGGTFKCMVVQKSANLYCNTVFGATKALKKHMKEKKCTLFCADEVENTESTPGPDLAEQFNDLSIVSQLSHEMNSADENGKFSVFIESMIEKLNTFNLQHDVFSEIIQLSKDLLSNTLEINRQVIRKYPQEDVDFVLKSTDDFAASELDKFVSNYRRKRILTTLLPKHCK